MNRREALCRVGVLLGGTVVGANFFWKDVNLQTKISLRQRFYAEDIAYLDEIADTIIPATDSPGAKAAKVGAFMTVMVRDCYDRKDQKTFMEGMEKINDAAKKNSIKYSWRSHRNNGHELLVRPG